MTRRIDAVSRAARAWRDPDHKPRRDAVERTLKAPNRFTEEAVAYAVNQQMEQLTAENLARWTGQRAVATGRVVGVLDPGAVPIGGLRELLAVILVGHGYAGSLQPSPPYLLQAFVDEVAAHTDIDVVFVQPEEVMERADALVVSGSDEQREWAAAQCGVYGIPPERRLIRPQRHTVAVLDGSESEDEREGLAEDILLHEGLSPWNAALIWAPRSLSPDDYLEAMAHFRSVFPTHEAMPGVLQMQRAFLEAQDVPHAYGEGLEFLVSKGQPEVQQPGHVRWSEYDDAAEVAAWLAARVDRVQAVTAREGLALDVPEDVPRLALGEAHRPRLDPTADRDDLIEFVLSL